MSSVLSTTPREVLVNLYIEQGIPVQQLAILFNVRESTIRNAFKKHGISLVHNSPTLYEAYQHKAFLRGHAFELTEQQFYSLIASQCHYCGRPPYHQHQKYEPRVRNGIDRADNAKGYTLENSRPCCGTCNAAKGVMSEQQFIELAQRIAAFQSTEKQR